MNIISNPGDINAIKEELKEASKSMTRIESERELLKDIKSNLVTKFNIPRKLASKVIKIYHQQNYQEVLDEQEELEVLYESLVKSPAKKDE